MLLLVFADRHLVGAVEQDVGGHEHRVVEQPHADALALAAARLVLELRHAPQLAHVGDGVEQPHELGVLRHVRLHDDDGALGVDAGREEHVGQLDRVAAQHGALLAHGDGVQVDDAEDAVVGLLHGDEVADRAQVVAEVQRAARLDAGEDARAALARAVGGRDCGCGFVCHGCRSLAYTRPMDDLGQLLTIGRFARVAGLTPKALRIYERMGILRPASIDPDTGYRYYSLTQLETAETVRLLRELEVPSDAGPRADHWRRPGGDTRRARTAPRDPRGAIEPPVCDSSTASKARSAPIANLSRTTSSSKKNRRGSWSACGRQIAGDQGDAPLNAAEWACEAELAARLAARGLAPAGRPITLHHNVLQWYEHYDVEVCLPVDDGAAGQLGGEAWELPGGPCATTVFRGPWEELSPAYAALHVLDRTPAAGGRGAGTLVLPGRRA